MHRTQSFFIIVVGKGLLEGINVLYRNYWQVIRLIYRMIREIGNWFMGKNINIKRVEYVGCFLIAFIILLLCSRSSLLYCYNNWDDANSYFSVGKCLMNGRVPYRDVFDQKGMYLYFIYGLAYLISHTSFAGVFVFELVAGFFLTLILLRILQLYLPNESGYNFFVMPILIACIFTSISFYWGGSAEEFMLPLLFFGVFLLLRFAKKEALHRTGVMATKEVFLAGILAGFVANIKFNSLGLYFAWMMLLFFYEIFNKKIKEALGHCFVFLGGMMLPFIPWACYFLYHHALYYWYEGYIYMNVFVYSDLNEAGPGLYDRIYTMAKIVYYLFFLNPQYMFLLAMGFLGFCLTKSVSLFEKISMVLLLGFLFVGIYIGGVELRYYSLPIAPFIVFGGIVIGFVWLHVTLKRKIQEHNYNCYMSFTVGMVLACLLCANLSVNVPFSKLDKKDYFLTDFATIIKESGIENPTLLNVNGFDAGLYTACDIIPNCRWFQTQTLPIPEPVEEQTRYMHEGQIDFVLACEYPAERIGDKYELIAQKHQITSDGEVDYYLYQKK